SKGSVFSFTEKLRAKAHCVNMFNKEILFTLWEDDAKGSGHNASNKLIDIKKAKVDLYGNVVVDFMLTKALMKKAMQGEADIRELEFYVTVEYYRNKKHTTANVDIQNPLPTENTPPSQSTGIKKAKGSPAEEKPKSKKEESGLLNPISETLGEIWDWVETQGTALRDKPHTIEIPEGKSPAIVGKTKGVKKEENKGGCFCKQEENQFYWSDKLTCDQRKKVLDVCKELWGEKNKKEKASQLMSIIYIETNKTFSPSADNGIGFSGLIQFNDRAAKGVGTTRAELKKMTFIKQMDYVKKYLEKRKDELNTMTDMYLLVMKPSAVGKGNDPDYAVFDESISVPDGDGSNTSYEQRMLNIDKEPWVTKYGYSSNPKFLTEKGEKEKRKKWVYTRQKYESRPGFIGGKTTIKEIEQVLKNEGFYLGKDHIFNGKCIDEQEIGCIENKRTPWMETVIQEVKNYGGKKEKTIDSRIKTYHKDGGGYEGDHDVAWCSSFVCWCLEQKNYKSPHSAGSRMFLTSRSMVKCGVFYGAIAIFSDCDSTGKNIQTSGHATFIYGKISDNVYACLGGNQGDMLKVSKYDCSGNVFLSWQDKKGNKHYKIFRGFYKPTDYIIKDIDKLTDNDNFSSADSANEQLNINIKSNKNGESSR
ncbi:hypothetical protein BWK59_14420, partial [Flavobacterium davisii]